MTSTDLQPCQATGAPLGNASAGWRLRCPECGGGAVTEGSDLICPSEGRRFEGEAGILMLLREERARELAPFLETYRRVRGAEGWRGTAAYYRSLPFRDRSGRHRDVWRLRARSFRAASSALDAHFGTARARLKVLELGAGNGWLSWRLAQRGHDVLVTDISVDDEDGLGALALYGLGSSKGRLTRARAEMEALPVEDAEFDLVIASGSLHYAEDPPRAISEAHRLLRAGGLLLVLDSPTFEEESAGREMVKRRDREHLLHFGVSPRGGPAGFLVFDRFHSLLGRSGFRTESSLPFEGVARGLRRLYCRARHLHPPARFPVFVAEKL